MDAYFLGGVMDLFKFHTPTGDGEDTHLVGGGEIINGLLTKEWTDRYRDAGSISITSRADRGVRELLPEGTLVGMRGNTSIMMIESHQLKDDDDSIVTTTGRSLEAFLDNRIVRWGLVNGEFVFDSNPQWVSWAQAFSLINSQVIAAGSYSDRLKYMEVVDDVAKPVPDGTSEPRKVPRGQLYAAVKSILAVDDIGWKVVRPGPWSPALDFVNNIAFVLHSGIDRRSEITMSYESGDIESADYLWSIQNHKNVAIVYSTWITQVVGLSSVVGLKRRVQYVDGKDIDEAQTTGTGWSDITTAYIEAAVRSRGVEDLAFRKKIALSSVTPTMNARTHVYGRDYDIGDIVTARGNFTESRPMRVAEYVYIEDENGEFGYPTLEVLEEEI
jgi:Siphovirus ReqiPepy6 Gp37-like protein